MKKFDGDISQLYDTIKRALIEPTYLSNSDKLTKYIIAKALLNGIRDRDNSRNVVAKIVRTFTYQHFTQQESVLPKKFPGYVRFRPKVEKKEEFKNRKTNPNKETDMIEDMFFRQATICLEHRSHARKNYYLKAFESGRDVLYLSIMSQASMQWMKKHLKKCTNTNTNLRVLTWHRNTSPDIVDLFRKHLGENDQKPALTLRQVKEASESWEVLAKEFDCIKVREYVTPPTMQAVIVKEEWALIELLPYNLDKDDRPALVLHADKHPDLFNLFVQQFEEMWNDCDQGGPISDSYV